MEQKESRAEKCAGAYSGALKTEISKHCNDLVSGGETNT